MALFLVCLMHLNWLHLFLRVAVVHVEEDGLGVIEAVMARVLAVICVLTLALELLIEVLDQLNFHLLVDIIQ